jgi:hypothetical protein
MTDDHEFRVANPAGDSPEAAAEIEQTVEDARADFRELAALDGDWYGPTEHTLLSEIIRSSLTSKGIVTPERVAGILSSREPQKGTTEYALFSRLEMVTTQKGN